MSILTFLFFIFLLITVLFYYILPRKYQWQVLLAGSIVFYAWAGPFYLVFIALSIVITWYLMLKPSKISWYFTLFLNLGILILCRIFVKFDIHGFVIPLGISFYTLMILGYAHDCMIKRIEPEKNLLKFALFVSYFPQITQGPIGSYEDLKEKLFCERSINYQNITDGSYRIIKGLFKKFVIAGRLTYYVDTVFANPKGFSGITLITAVFFYTIELYADFSGYMDMACGISKLFGIELAENFKRPYFSKSIPEFWRRWHITLNEWFKEHLMMPGVISEWNRVIVKGLNKIFTNASEGTLRTIFPLMIVWIVSGLWHGLKDVYLCWGFYFALIMILSVCMKPTLKQVRKKLHIQKNNKIYTVFCVVKTYFIFFLGEVMFASNNMKDACYIYQNIFTKTRVCYDEFLKLLIPFGNGNQAVASFIIIAVIILGLFIVEYLKEKNENAFSKHKYLQAACMIIITILFGVIRQTSFLYQAF